MDIVFLGSGAFAIPSLEALLRSGHRLLHVFSQPDRPAGRGNKLTPTPVSQWALARAAEGVQLTRVEDANQPETLEQLRRLAPGCLVVIAFGQKLSDELLGIAPHGGINLHSSLLPKYRGAAPINWAVINDDAEAGVSVIEVTRVMDAGAILAKASTPIGAAETAGELHDRLALLGAPLLPAVLEGLERGVVERIAQDASKATRAPKLSREMAWVDFTRPAAEVSARIRGLSPWPGVQVELIDAGGKPRVRATVVKCQASVSTAEHPAERCGMVLADRTVACGKGSLVLLMVQPAGKKGMDLQALANGYRYGPGARVASVQKKLDGR
jgi:methionyl-tRNA formyltransferase